MLAHHAALDVVLLLTTRKMPKMSQGFPNLLLEQLAIYSIVRKYGLG